MPGPKKSQVAAMRDAQMAEMYKSGMDSSEIAKQFGVSPARVIFCLKRIGVEMRPRGNTKRVGRNEDRRKEAIEMLRQGMFQEEIGAHFGVSGTVIHKYLVELKKNAEEYESVMADAELARFAKKTGVSPSEFPSFDEAKRAWRVFTEQRSQAAWRGVDWEMTFAEWWNIWSESGHWSERGKSHAGAYVMGRFGDTGPYKIGNVHIITFSQNISDYWKCSYERTSGEAYRK